jgi:hypothetical protein
MATEKDVPKSTAIRNESHSTGNRAMKMRMAPPITTARRKTCARPRPLISRRTIPRPIPMPTPHSAASHPNAASEPWSI